jgi:RNA polymerase sigma factor (sigma-70 family)
MTLAVDVIEKVICPLDSILRRTPSGQVVYQIISVRQINGRGWDARRGRNMPTSPMNRVIEHLRSAVLRDSAGPGDGELLGCFIECHDEGALACLVKRHAPMVWGVCRRLLSHHDAEDAFQATFLVLVRKAASIVPREMVANWLYGVAHQTALQARRTAARRRAREVQVTVMPEPEVVQQDPWPDVRPLLDQELSCLPGNYRAVLVLCDLQGRTRKEVARQLGVPEGTVAGRLARARAMLARRLTQRGVTLSGGALAAVLAQNVAPAGVPDSVVSSTITIASSLAAGQVATGLVSVKVAALTKGVLRSMLLNKLRPALGMVLLLVGFGVGAVWVAPSAPAQPATERARAVKEVSAPSEQVSLGRHVESLTWLLTSVDTRKKTLSASWMRSVGHSTGWTSTFVDFEAEYRTPEPVGHFYLKDVPLAERAQVFIDGQEGRLEDLKRGMRLTVRMATGKTGLVLVEAHTQTVLVTGIDVQKNTLTVRTMGKDVTVPVAKNARVLLAYHSGEHKFTDLKVGMRVDLEIGVEGGKIAVTRIRGQTLSR